MRKKIIFQKCHFNNIYFLFYIIADCINLFIEYKLYPDKTEITIPESKYYLPIKMLINFYIYNLCDFLAVIPYFISKKLLKKKETNINIENEEDKNINDLELICNNKEKLISKSIKKSIKLYCIFIAILDFLQKFSLVLYSIIYPDKDIEVYPFSCYASFEIILQFICSYCILKIHFYKLQYFSLFLNLGIFIIILTIDLINIIIFHSFDGKSFFFYAINIIFYSIEYSYVKKMLLYGFISIYLFMIIKGAFLLILVTLFSLIMFFVKKDVFSRFLFFLTNVKYILLIIAKIISNFFVNLFLWIIIDRYSPNYYPLVLIFNQCFILLFDKIVDSTEYVTMGWDLYFRIFLYVISAIGIMIHNEIVVINICNLGSDTKYFLDLKFEIEELYANTDDPSVMKRFETAAELGTVNGENRNLIENEKENTSSA